MFFFQTGSYSPATNQSLCRHAPPPPPLYSPICLCTCVNNNFKSGKVKTNREYTGKHEHELVLENDCHAKLRSSQRGAKDHGLGEEILMKRTKQEPNGQNKSLVIGIYTIVSNVYRCELYIQKSHIKLIIRRKRMLLVSHTCNMKTLNEHKPTWHSFIYFMTYHISLNGRA